MFKRNYSAVCLRIYAGICTLILLAQACTLPPAPPSREVRTIPAQPVSDALYVIAGDTRVPGAQLLAVDLRSNRVTARVALGNQAVVATSADGRLAYLFSDAPGGRPDDPMPGMLSAVSLRNGRVMWEMPLPARPFAVGPFGAWLSHDEKRIYLQSTRDGLNPRMLTIDVQARHMLHDHSLHIPYPANVDQAFPIAWRLPWTERFIVISRDQLYAYDPGTGQKSDVIHLFKPDDRALVPWDMPRATFVMDGLMDASRRRLILATSTQELIWVDLTTSPFTLHRVAKLTPGWRFGGASGLLLHPDGMTLYAQVRPVYPVEQIMAVTEVLSFDTKTWQQTGRHVLCQDPYGCDSLFRRGAPYSFGLLIHPSDNRLYAFTEHGLMQVDQPPNTALEENLMKIDGLNTSDWYTILYSPGG